MGRRYRRRFLCEDCGQMTERMWQTGRPKVCIECGKVRFVVAVDAARAAVKAHTRACRIRLRDQRAAARAAEEGTVPLSVPAGPPVSDQGAVKADRPLRTA